MDRALTSSDPAICDEIATTHFVQTFYNGSISECKKDAENTSDNPDSIDVTNVKVDGDKATADVTVHGGPNDGQKLTASFVTESGKWKLDGATAGPTGTSTTATGASTDTTATGPTTTGATSGDPLTELFFSTIRTEVKKKGLSDTVATCIVDKLRTTITPQEIAQIKAGQRPPSLSAKSRTAGQQCAHAALSGP
jgi:hypothetical protein